MFRHPAARIGSARFASIVSIASVTTIASLAVLTVLSLGCPAKDGPGTAAAGELRDVLLVTVDGWISDEMAMFGGPHATPALAALAEEGTFWRDGWTAVPMTRPGVASILTGLPLSEHGVRDDVLHGLPEGIETLADALRTRGYATVAFPDAASLGADSGLLRGFDVVRDPVEMPVWPYRYLPNLVPPDELPGAVADYLATVPDDRPVFAWVHLSPMLNEQMVLRAKARDLRRKDSRPGEEDEADDAIAAGPKSKAKARERQIEAAEETESRLPIVDEALAGVFDAFRTAGRWGGTTVFVSGTLGLVDGEDGAELEGAGFSMAPAALRVPVLGRRPGGATFVRAADEPVSTLDVAATVRELAGLPAVGGGVSLLAPDGDRVLTAASWALLDQMNWEPIRAARRGGWMLRDDREADARRWVRLAAAAAERDAALEADLHEAIAGVEPPPLPTIESETIAGILAELEIEPQPLSRDGREFAGFETRELVAHRLWSGRRFMASRQGLEASVAYRRAIRNDRGNYGALLDLLQLYSTAERPGHRRWFKTAVRTYPTDPEMLHWAAHKIWNRSIDNAETILLEVVQLYPNNPDLLYDLACTRSLAGDLDASEAYLRRSMEAGYDVEERVMTDPDLRNLRADGRLAAVLGSDAR